jgi:hypothetical protein
MQLLEKRLEDGACIDAQCHNECLAEIHRAVAAGELKHSQIDLKKFDGLIWMEFIGERMRYANSKLEHYQADMDKGVPCSREAYNFWLAYAKFYTILFDELGDALCRDFEKIPRDAANGLELALKDFIEFSLKQ